MNCLEQNQESIVQKHCLKPCHLSECVQVDSAVPNCWCDTDEIDLKKMHNKWVDLLNSLDSNLDEIEDFNKQCHEKYGVYIYKEPKAGWNEQSDWSNFDFLVLGDLIAQAGKLIFFKRR